MGNVVVHEVSQPTAKRKWAKRYGTHPFYRKFRWGAHVQQLCRCWSPLPSGKLMAAPGAAICIAHTNWRSVAPVTKPIWVRWPSLSNQGRETVGTHLPWHIYSFDIESVNLFQIWYIKWFQLSSHRWSLANDDVRLQLVWPPGLEIPIMLDLMKLPVKSFFFTMAGLTLASFLI